MPYLIAQEGKIFSCPADKQDSQLSGTLAQSWANIVTSVRMLEDTKDEKMDI